MEEINYMMEARIPTREWTTYDLATVVAKDEKKGARFGGGTAEHVEDHAGDGRVRRFADGDSDDEA